MRVKRRVQKGDLSLMVFGNLLRLQFSLAWEHKLAQVKFFIYQIQPV